LRPPHTAPLWHAPGGPGTPAAGGLAPGAHRRTGAQWLREPPGGEVLARERASAYAAGARQGAPGATQAAARFHGLQTLKAVLDHMFTTPEKTLDAVQATLGPPPVPLAAGALAVLGPAPARSLPAPQGGAVPRQGWTAPALAQPLGLSRRPVPRALQTATCAGRTRPKPYRRERWKAGGSTAMRLCRAWRQPGSPGSEARGAAEARRGRPAPGLPPAHRGPRQPLPRVAEPPGQP
jgi:hypothetical protein